MITVFEVALYLDEASTNPDEVQFKYEYDDCRNYHKRGGLLTDRTLAEHVAARLRHSYGEPWEVIEVGVMEANDPGMETFETLPFEGSKYEFSGPGSA